MWAKQDHHEGDRWRLFAAVGSAIDARTVLHPGSSHGDAALASTDDRYELAGVVSSRDGDYRVSSNRLDTHLVPKKSQDVSAESLHRTQRGIAYTKQAFAYLFTRVR